MPYALELALDTESAAFVRSLWQRMADAGFPFMAESGAHPHVSLAIWDDVDRSRMEDAVGDFAAETPRLDVVLSAVATFPSTGVVYLAVHADERLRVAQRRCHEALAAHGRGAWADYAPGAWIPHCTLAMDVDDALARLVAVADTAPLPRLGRLERAELVEFRPVRHLMAVPLAGG